MPAPPIDGLLVVDKPAGPTSHDVVDRIRRVLGERRVGHTGTLDPGATGVLVLVIGRATRLARFMAADDKAYDAHITLGLNTDSYDADGTPVGDAFGGPWPPRADVQAALGGLMGARLQRPPAYSAKKIAGRRAYDLARRRQEADSPAVQPDPVAVTLSEALVTRCEHEIVEVRLVCSAGFYVRSLAHDLGVALGTGAHLSALRRTRSGGSTADQATPLGALEGDPAGARARVVPMSAMLPGLPAVTLNEAGASRAVHGNVLGPGDCRGDVTEGTPPFLRLFSPGGDLLAIAEATGRPGFLHPSVVLV